MLMSVVICSRYNSCPEQGCSPINSLVTVIRYKSECNILYDLREKSFQISKRCKNVEQVSVEVQKVYIPQRRVPDVLSTLCVKSVPII
jgi:hypothetical protein